MPAVGDSVTIRGTVTESAGLGYPGNTLVTGATILGAASGGALPEPVLVTTADAVAEAYEGVLVTVEGAVCTIVNAGYGEWQVNDGSGAAYVDRLGYRLTPRPSAPPTTSPGPLNYRYGLFKSGTEERRRHRVGRR